MSIYYSMFQTFLFAIKVYSFFKFKKSKFLLLKKNRNFWKAKNSIDTIGKFCFIFCLNITDKSIKYSHLISTIFGNHSFLKI
ncbi:hypothetical protein BpHYR1_034355 [Brachionus plicatilis]|uniref:Uncharacterized protein n=1 Tax=Brachionus plicatilis TaxID=10195 RepID=A0A3M7PHC2_BRAPC|nr:hypothetical protein BpHYR1_034355 [Brachionus plicatilis]